MKKNNSDRLSMIEEPMVLDPQDWLKTIRDEIQRMEVTGNEFLPVILLLREKTVPMLRADVIFKHCLNCCRSR